MGKLAKTGRPLAATGIRFTVGRDASGRWIVNDIEGKVGGLFTDRASAVHFAMFESDHVPGAVWCVPDHLTLTFGGDHAGRRTGAAVHAAGRASR